MLSWPVIMVGRGSLKIKKKFLNKTFSFTEGLHVSWNEKGNYETEAGQVPHLSS